MAILDYVTTPWSSFPVADKQGLRLVTPNTKFVDDYLATAPGDFTDHTDAIAAAITAAGVGRL